VNQPMSSPAADLFDRITTRSARAGVVGLGYVGLPLAVELGRAGFTVAGIDVDGEKVAAVNRGESYIPDVHICVPTPLRKTKDPDMSYIVKAVETIVGVLRKGQLVILESTTYPGTTDEVVRTALEERGLRAGRISTWRSRPSAWIRATRISRRRTSRRSWAGTTRRAHARRWRSTAR
jgi:UDP-N-acetyl-D-glucosamine dehydrogenase